MDSILLKVDSPPRFDPHSEANNVKFILEEDAIVTDWRKCYKPTLIKKKEYMY